ncbi:MAG: AAA family ATPase [Candidatus Diapherotrites archaeon]|nr:AAA family ATPase [Candidatus Diapherotrites archaeon]
MKLIITGPPASGKTTLVKEICKRRTCSGFYTEEVREGRMRVGFDAVRIESGERLPIARRGYPGPRVGSYGVILENLERVVEWLRELEGFVAIDEIGPMELKHPRFEEEALKALRRAEGFVVTVHRSLWKKWKELLGAEVVFLSRDNRDEVFREVLSCLDG